MKIPKQLTFDYRLYREDMLCPLCARTVWVGMDENGKESICQACYEQAYAA